MDVAEARAVLGVATDADWDAVRTAYRRLVRAHHPDVQAADGVPAGDGDASARTARLNVAVAVLRRDLARPGGAGGGGDLAAASAPAGPSAGAPRAWAALDVDDAVEAELQVEGP